MSNLLLKLGSLFAAICLAIFVNYFFVPAELGPRVVQLIAPVEVRNVPENKSLIWPATRQVELTVQGSSLFMSKLALSPPVVRIALPEGAAKSFVAKLSADNINLPATVRLLGIKPSEIEFRLDDIINKKLPVVVPQIGNLSSDYKIEKVKIEPSEVTLRGPSQEINDAINLETIPVNLSLIQATTVLELEVRMPWTLAVTDVKSIRVTFEVSEVESEQTFNNVPVVFEVESDELKSRNIRLAQKSSTVVLSGPKRIVKNVKKESLILRAKINPDEPLKESLDITLDPIEGISTVNISPRRATIAVDPLPTPTPAAKSASNVKKKVN